MIHAYSDAYVNVVMHNLAALFDIAINAEGLDADAFGETFAASRVAEGIEAGAPNMLAGKSATEMLAMILGRDVEYTVVPMERTPEYWGGWILAYAQWYLGKSFKEILSVMSFGKLVSMYHPYHEADERKMVERIRACFPVMSALREMRRKRRLTQEQLALLSGVNVRSIRAYEQGDNDIGKAQVDTVRMLARALGCTIEELVE